MKWIASAAAPARAGDTVHSHCTAQCARQKHSHQHVGGREKLAQGGVA